LLQEHHAAILQRSSARIRQEVGHQVTDAELADGVPVFVDQLVRVLRRDLDAPNEPTGSAAEDKSEMDSTAARHGEALLRIGFTISQVVRGYGAACQVITGLLDELGVRVSAREYETLNRCLDDAIAEAVSAFEAQSGRDVAEREVEHLGRLAHELRNALTVAMSTLQILKLDGIGFSGRAPTMLEHALVRMRDLIDRSLAEVRLRANLRPVVESIRLAEVFDYVETTAGPDAKKRGLELRWEVEPALRVEADRQLLVSAVSNLVQNALKYSRRDGIIVTRAARSAAGVRVEVEDACGGLPEETLHALFEPYMQAGHDRTGLGLGLRIVQRSIDAHHGTVRVRNLAGKGCVFTIELPAHAVTQVEQAGAQAH
jgi:signal transduction histidine kinase